MNVQYSGDEQRSTQFFPRHLANFEGKILQLHFMFVAYLHIAYFAFSCTGKLHGIYGMNMKRITQ